METGPALLIFTHSKSNLNALIAQYHLKRGFGFRSNLASALTLTGGTAALLVVR